ncbi:MAG: ATPase [Oscillochloris sp.]|nr:ATPase [Oscillochloris sp.]
MTRPDRSLSRRFSFVLVVMFVLAGIGSLGRPSPTAAQSNPPRTAFVHLFEWKWTDIAQECENFLGPKGYAAVQVSPPNEHAVVAGRPWYERYQPVSYQIESRSGTRAEFSNMVSRCNAVGVDIYVDAVINHMTGVGSGSGIAGSTYTDYTYPGTYAPWDFHYCGRNGNNDIQNYGDRYEVQNCELVNLADLNTGSTYVRDRIAAYMNDLIGLGVAGFRIDAAKHMDTNDVAAIVARLNGDPYIFQEVIAAAGEPVQEDEYFQNGDVTEFQYSTEISRVFLNGQLSWLSQFGTAWGFMPSDRGVIFTDNHDNQRGHGGGGSIITHKNGTLYDLANVFMLAWPYGYPKVMSSYAFSDGSHGPPSDANGNTNSIYVNGTPDCFDEWKCEHRWQPIANMVGFRNATSGNFFTSDWWSNGNNQIAFGRGDAGYVVINREGNSLSRTFQTSLAAGTYCNVFSGDLVNGTCSGDTITVNSAGQFTATVPAYAALAIHIGAQLSSPPPSSVAASFNVNATTTWGQNVYVVGNIPALGNWNTANAIPLSAAGYPIWSGTVSIPTNTAVEYKYIKKDGGNVVWESGANRTFNSGAGGALSFNDTWRN